MPSPAPLSAVPSTSIVPDAIRTTLPQIPTSTSSVLPAHATLDFTMTPDLGIEGNDQNRLQMEKKEKNNTNEIRNSLLAGSIAGMISCALFHPMDVIRTKMQNTTQIHKVSKTATSSTTENIAHQSMKRGILTAKSGPMTVVSHTLKNGGIKSLYTGLSLPLAAQGLYKATVLTTNRYVKSVLEDYKSSSSSSLGRKYQLNYRDYFICGAASGVANALLFVAPVEFVRSQLIAQHTQMASSSSSGTIPKHQEKILHGPMDVIRRTLQKDGIFGLWKGAAVTVVRDSIGCGAFFVMYEIGQANIPRLIGSNYNNSQDEFVTTSNSRMITMMGSGLMAGFGYWITSLPLDALKTLVQSGHANSARGALSILVTRDGYLKATQQLYRGWQLAFGRGMPAACISLSTYDVIYRMCEASKNNSV